MQGGIFFDRFLRAGLENPEFFDLQLLHTVVHGEEIVVEQGGFFLFFLCGDPLFSGLLAVFEEGAQFLFDKGRHRRDPREHLQGEGLDGVALSRKKVGQIEGEDEDGKHDHTDRAEHLRDRITEDTAEQTAAERLPAATVEFTDVENHVGTEIGHGVNEAGEHQKKHDGKNQTCQPTSAAIVRRIKECVQKDHDRDGKRGGREKSEEHARDQRTERPRVLRKKAKSDEHRKSEEKYRDRTLKTGERLFGTLRLLLCGVFVIHHLDCPFCCLFLSKRSEKRKKSIILS